MSQKFEIPSEVIDLPSKGLLYPKENKLSLGTVELKYMTAKEEDIMTNPNLLRQGVAVERMLKSLIKSEIDYGSLTVGDRNGLLIASRILAYGKDYSFKYAHPDTGEEETVTIDLQELKYKECDWSKFNNKNEFEFELPYSKNTVIYKILTVEDDKKIDDEIKGLKKVAGAEAGRLSTRLKHQIIAVNGEYSTKTVRDFVDSGALLSRDSIVLRQDMTKNTPDIDTTIKFNMKDGTEVVDSLPMGIGFFFPQLD